jgi:hypothetical protein
MFNIIDNNILSYQFKNVLQIGKAAFDRQVKRFIIVLIHFPTQSNNN